MIGGVVENVVIPYLSEKVLLSQKQQEGLRVDVLNQWNSDLTKSQNYRYLLIFILLPISI
jgi:hypothetical protein